MLTLPPVAPSLGWRASVRLPRDYYIRLDGNVEDDPRLRTDWTGTEVPLSPAADPAKYRDAVATAAGDRLPLLASNRVSGRTRLLKR